jgi:hypothetical protein
MSEFSDQRRKIYEAAKQFMSQFGEGADNIFDQMASAEEKFEEQTVVIASQNETIKALQEENERITADFQIRVDLQDQEIAALRSQINQKTKEFSGLSRTVHSMIISARNIVSLGAHGMNLVARDAVGDKIVTQLRGHPQRQTTVEGASLSSVLNAAGERLPTERERAIG